MRNPAYSCLLKDDILEIARSLKTWQDNVKCDTSIFNIVTLGRCMFESSTELIRAYYACLETRSYYGALLIERALLELNVDFRLLVVLQDSTWVRRFLNYCKLTQYWQADGIEFLSEMKPDIVREYRSYVDSEFASEFAGHSKTLDQSIRNKYRKSWSGMNFAERVKKIVELDAKSTEYILQKAPYQFGVSSQFTHPTPYGAIPHFSPQSFDFKFEWQCPDKYLQMAEHFAFIMLDMSTRSFAKTLADAEARTLLTLFNEQYKLHPGIARRATEFI